MSFLMSNAMATLICSGIGIRSGLDYFSEVGTFYARMTPGLCIAGNESPRLEVRASADGHLLWERDIVNAFAPEQVFIADSRPVVITINEAFSHRTSSVVAYGQDGRLLAVYDEDQLGLSRETQEWMLDKAQTRNWSADANFFFFSNDEYFCCWLPPCQFLVLDTNVGSLLTTAGSQGESAVAIAAGEALDARVPMMLDSVASGQRRRGAIAAGQRGLCIVVDQLRALQRDGTTSWWRGAGFYDDGVRCVELDGEFWTFPIRRAVRRALAELGDVPDDSIPQYEVPAAPFPWH